MFKEAAVSVPRPCGRQQTSNENCQTGNWQVSATSRSLNVAKVTCSPLWSAVPIPFSPIWAHVASHTLNSLQLISTGDQLSLRVLRLSPHSGIGPRWWKQSWIWNWERANLHFCHCPIWACRPRGVWDERCLSGSAGEATHRCWCLRRSHSWCLNTGGVAGGAPQNQGNTTETQEGHSTH